MIASSSFDLLLIILIVQIHVIRTEYMLQDTQVYVRPYPENENTINDRRPDVTNVKDLLQTTTDTSRMPSIFVRSIPLINSNCFCVYDQLMNLFQCSPFLQSYVSFSLTSTNRLLINVTINDCTFNNNRFNLPSIQDKTIDRLQLNDINHQDYLVFDSTSFASTSINTLSINYTYIQPITMILLSNETFASPVLRYSLQTLHIESCYLLTLNQPFNCLISLQSITLMNIPQFSWYDFQQQIVSLPNLRRVYLGENIVPNTHDIFNVLSCQDLSPRWMLTYRLIQTCSCQLLAFLQTVERVGNRYRCRNSATIVDFIDDICQIHNREYLIYNQTNLFCNRCLFNRCDIGTLCAESPDLNSSCLPILRYDYITIRTRLPLTSLTQSFLIQENYQYLLFQPNLIVESNTLNGIGIAIVDPNRTQTINSLSQVHLLHQTFVEILGQPTIVPSYANTAAATIVRVPTWNKLIRSLDESIKNINDTQDMFEFKSKPISTVSLVFPMDRQPPDIFGWKIADDNTITTNVTDSETSEINATSRVFLRFDKSRSLSSYYCDELDNTKTCKNRFSITSLKSPKLFSETNAIPEYDVISIIAPTSNQRVTFYFDQKLPLADRISPSTNITNTTTTTTNSSNSFYDQLDLMILEGTCMYLNMTSMNWQSDGCTTDRQLSNNVSVTCTCEHLTMFTVFFSLTCTKPSIGLNIISWIGCGLSLIGLSITLVMFIVISQCRRGKNGAGTRKSSSQSTSNQELKRKPIIKSGRLSMVKSMLFILCILLILMNILIFILTFVKPGRNIACMIFSLALYYLTLAAFLWKFFFALQQSLFITNIFRPFWSNRTLFLIYFILTFSLPICPLLILLIKFSDWTFISSTCNYCWLSREFLFFGLLIPVLTIILLNFLFYMYTMIYLYRTNREHPGLRSTKSEQSRDVQNFKIAIFFAVIMGFSWILAFLVLIPNSYVQLVGNILFCVVNSIQGFAFSIMVFWMLERKSFRKYCCFWRSKNRLKATIHSQDNSPRQLESISNDENAIKVKSSYTSSTCTTSTSNGESPANQEIINRFRNPKLATQQEEDDEDDEEHVYTRLPL